MSKAPLGPEGLPPPWDPVQSVKADAAAIKALATGTATPDQQKRALNWIIYGAAATYELEYRRNERDHAFMSGRRQVGHAILTLLKADLSSYDKPKS